MIKEYSMPVLTKDSDQLVAVGCIARKIHQVTGFTYLAGLWLEGLPRSLCWDGCGIYRSWEKDGAQPTKPNGPSWSWAARKPHSRMKKIGWQHTVGWVPDPRV